MARTDPPLYANVPQFVHDDLDALVQALEAEGCSKTSLVGALIHAARIAATRTALRNYKRDEVEFRRSLGNSDPE